MLSLIAQRSIDASKDQVSEAQLYQLSHQVAACKQLAREIMCMQEGSEKDNQQQCTADPLDMQTIFDRMQPAVSDAVWRNRRENLINEQRRIYNENLRTNELVNRHDLLGYIDRKLAN